MKAMTWECAEDEYNPNFSAKPDEYVRFRFVENPRCFDVTSSKDFCAELRKAGKSVVDVEFEVWNHGYNLVAVDGRPVQNVGGWGHNGANDYSGGCPPMH
jgi:hypothetical protein